MTISPVQKRELSSVLVFSKEVKQALDERRPVVALESTIISHGMPYPKNIETAKSVEAAIREKGVVPATIAVIDGKIRVGLSDSDLEFLGQPNPAKTLMKLSRRDLAYALATRASGATTVAATMICAEIAGIQVFATGGIGGVHRGAEKTLDISADLQELAKTRVVVVCAGVKSILDIGLTLEVLETLGVPVFGYQTNIFPSFFSRESSFKVEYRFDHPAEIASVMNYQERLGLQGGLLIVNPIPQEHEIPHELMEKEIQKALELAHQKGIQGKAVTPFLLGTLVAMTQGKSLEANIALIHNNARLAAGLALAIHQA